MARLTKRAKAMNELVKEVKELGIKEAIAILKKAPATKFDQTVEVALHLNVDQATVPIRGTVTLPHGTGKKTRVAVFCKGDFVEKAQSAGADFVGGDDLLKKVSEGWLDFDVAVTTPDMMKDLAKLGKVLGPRGLMPNPKSGTVTTEIAKAVKELKAGKIEYRMDKQSGVTGPVGKLSFSEEALMDNVTAFVRSVIMSSPKLQKGQNVKSISISSTMGPGIKLEKNQFREG
ncbi:MAG: 50S ribosomal protein L1 [Candidatus Omnitrophica bacterium]|nr:50S ribosomal protein L1 [Candidatus Omnitrophota bacterium]MDD5487408.1 50S ribosomal protein L1 [Candidatus Omnitrophota bacterium]